MISERVFAVRATAVKCRSFFLGWLVVSALFSHSPSITAQVTVWTQHNDNDRSGWNSKETKLTPALLGSTTVQNGQRVPSLFGKLFVHDLDDQPYSQPLYVPHLTMSVDKKVHNVVFVTTVNNSVYAFDADNKDANGGKPLWHTNVTPRGARPPNVADMNNQGVCSGNYRNFAYNMGIAGTPVIDVGKNAIYFVARTAESDNQFFQRIHALDIRSGKEILGGPKTIAARYEGSSFNAFNENQRAALALVNGVVYVAWASHCDGLEYKGWILGFSASNLGLVSIWNDEPNGGEGGIWQAGQGPAADSAGNLYVLTGNGNWDPGAGDYGMSALKLHPTSQGSLSVNDYFTPMNHAELNEGDTDLGSAGALLVPGTHTLIGGGKEGVVYVIDTNHMGHVNQHPTEFAATFGPQNETHHIHGSPIFFNGGSSKQYLYLWGENDGLRAFRYGETQTAAKSLFNSPIRGQGMPGGFLSGSSNGTSDGIVWALTPAIGDSTNNTVPGSLLAFDATNFAPSGSGATNWMKLLWSSDGFPARDSVGYYAKFTYPTVANGKVYVVGWGGAGKDDCLNSVQTNQCWDYSNPPNRDGQLIVYGSYLATPSIQPPAPPPPSAAQCAKPTGCVVANGSAWFYGITCTGEDVGIKYPGDTCVDNNGNTILCRAGFNGSSTASANWGGSSGPPRFQTASSQNTIEACTTNQAGESNCANIVLDLPTCPSGTSLPSSGGSVCGTGEEFCSEGGKPKCVPSGECSKTPVK